MDELSGPQGPQSESKGGETGGTSRSPLDQKVDSVGSRTIHSAQIRGRAAQFDWNRRILKQLMGQLRALDPVDQPTDFVAQMTKVREELLIVEETEKKAKAEQVSGKTTTRSISSKKGNFFKTLKKAASIVAKVVGKKGNPRNVVGTEMVLDAKMKGVKLLYVQKALLKLNADYAQYLEKKREFRSMNDPEVQQMRDAMQASIDTLLEGLSWEDVQGFEEQLLAMQDFGGMQLPFTGDAPRAMAPYAIGETAQEKGYDQKVLHAFDVVCRGVLHSISDTELQTPKIFEYSDPSKRRLFYSWNLLKKYEESDPNERLLMETFLEQMQDPSQDRLAILQEMVEQDVQPGVTRMTRQNSPAFYQLLDRILAQSAQNGITREALREKFPLCKDL